MNSLGYVILNKDLSDTQINFIYNYAQNYSLYDKNVLMLKGKIHSLSLKEIIEDLFQKNYSSLEEDFLCNHGSIIILNDLHSYNFEGMKHTDIQIPLDLNLISKKQIQIFKNFFTKIETYDEVVNIGPYPEELIIELSKHPEINNISNIHNKTKAIYKLFISKYEEELKVKRKIK